MKLLDWRVSPDTPDSDVQVLHSVGVRKQGVLPEFPRSSGDMKSGKEWDNWIMGTSPLLWAGNLVISVCTLVIYLLDKNGTKLGGLQQKFIIIFHAFVEQLGLSGQLLLLCSCWLMWVGCSYLRA